ncbi:hypothetical protein RF11_14997 [Thelohanellus kitauei]|uniref:Uncharacterized protein n=1 Tax=Thelohanellus kitauei TaxID=669202 RepID=A0A0C2MHF1_THEKT|nr:hypothetical protein RF11_14997 [Thelohanellus kitauei]
MQNGVDCLNWKKVESLASYQKLYYSENQQNPDNFPLKLTKHEPRDAILSTLIQKTTRFGLFGNNQFGSNNIHYGSKYCFRKQSSKNQPLSFHTTALKPTLTGQGIFSSEFQLPQIRVHDDNSSVLPEINPYPKISSDQIQTNSTVSKLILNSTEANH